MLAPTLPDMECIVSSSKKVCENHNLLHGNGLRLEIVGNVSDKSSLESVLIADMFSIFESNMVEMYKKSSWGWDPRKKLAEFKESDMVFVLLYAGTGLAGFLSFKICIEDDIDEQPHLVSYCYECQVSRQYQNKGYGKTLLGIWEEISRNLNVVERTMLTVFSVNKDAIRFYQRNGYDHACTCPTQCLSEEDSAKYDYYILKKDLKL